MGDYRVHRSPRADAYPEAIEYRDTGCDLAPSCLRCPFEVCRFDLPEGAQALQRLRRDPLIVELARSVSVNAAAAEYGLSRRSVFRILAEARSHA